MMKTTFLSLFLSVFAMAVSAQMPNIEPGVSQELAKWRSARYSDVRYKLNLTLEKMSPVLKGTIEVRVTVSEPPASAGGQKGDGSTPPIILDWRKIRGHEEKSTISNVSVNGKAVSMSASWPPANAGGSDFSEHLIFSDGVVAGENVIKLDFTSPILTSGSAITRYIDKEDGSEYLYSLFVPSDASTAFPVFDQPDIKARFSLFMSAPREWKATTNAGFVVESPPNRFEDPNRITTRYTGVETEPISTYVFAFAAGPWEKVDAIRSVPPAVAGGSSRPIEKQEGNESGNNGWSSGSTQPPATAGGTDIGGSIYVRKSQAAKFKPHAAEVFRLNRESVKFFEQYFDYKFPFPKYDLVLIPEFPFGGMEHAGATFLRESAIIFPQEPTKNDHISRAILIFHEAAHQWFGDTVTMKWFDDLWLKEGFANFAAYKALEKIMPEANAWKVFYERIKQGAYATDSTKGTTAIYQPIANLSAAKSAYGNIVYNKAPAFLRQAEFYLGEEKFQTAVRAFLKKHEFANAGWENLVAEFDAAGGKKVNDWANRWINQRGVPTLRFKRSEDVEGRRYFGFSMMQSSVVDRQASWGQKVKVLESFKQGSRNIEDYEITERFGSTERPILVVRSHETINPDLTFSNYGDYGYGIFLLDAKSRDYVLKNIQNEKDPFLRSMMWGALWDSVREGELDPREYVELVVKVLMHKPARQQGRNGQVGGIALANAQASATEDESTTALLLNRVGTAMNYYLSEPPPLGGGQSRNSPNWPAANAAGSDLKARVENLLIDRMKNAETLGQRITYYRAFLNIASSENARSVLKGLLKAEPLASASGKDAAANRSSMASSAVPPAYAGGSALPLKPKDKFDIVTKLIILGDADGEKLLAELEKSETSDDAKRWAYAARAGIPTAENKAKYWNDFVNNKDISESWIEAAFGPWNSIRHSELTLPYLERALKELPNHKRNRKIFFVNGWLGAFIGGQRSEAALGIVNKFLADNPSLDNDLRLKILENADVIERAVKIRDSSKK